MKYVEFYHEISKKHELSLYACDKVYALIKQAIVDVVVANGKCNINGFGKFYISGKKHRVVKFRFDEKAYKLINNQVSFKVRQDGG